VLGHRLTREATKKRKWIGPPYVSNQNKKPTPSESRPTMVELRPEGGSTPKPWWKTYSPKNVVAFDVEKINLRNLTGQARVKPGSIGIVDTQFNILMEEMVYHKPGSFLDGPKDSAVNGFTRSSLANGKNWDKEVYPQLKSSFTNKLVVGVEAQLDMACLNIERDDYEELFDLQSFYRRPKEDCSVGTNPMSLRDIYFHHFQEDCQAIAQHDATTDAISTMRIFMEGYIPLKQREGKVDQRENVENFDFSSAVKLKQMDKQGKKYCKTNSKFRNKCNCAYCVSKYINK
jgi:DNA polymerase III epsilon subunit-like protein